MSSQISSTLLSYAIACKEESKLKSFDSNLQKRATKLIDTINATQSRTELLTPIVLTAISFFLTDTIKESVRCIVESIEDLWKDKDLRSLVHDYFDCTSKSLEFCNSIEDIVRKAKNGQLLIRSAAAHFGMESQDTNLGGNNNKYVRTLEELAKFKDMFEPFGWDFKTLCESICTAHELFLNKLHTFRSKLDKKQKSIPTMKLLSNVLFGTTCVSIAAISMALPTLTLAILPIVSRGVWLGDMWKKYEEALKRKQVVVATMETGIEVTSITKDTTNVDGFKIIISSIVEKIDFALERNKEEHAIKNAMEAINETIEKFMWGIDELSEHADECRKFVTRGRLSVLEGIVSHTDKK